MSYHARADSFSSPLAMALCDALAGAAPLLDQCNYGDAAEQIAVALTEEGLAGPRRKQPILSRAEQVRWLMTDMALSGTVAKGALLFSGRKRLAEALVARGWRKFDMTDTARELVAKLQPPLPSAEEGAK